MELQKNFNISEMKFETICSKITLFKLGPSFMNFCVLQRFYQKERPLYFSSLKNSYKYFTLSKALKVTYNLNRYIQQYIISIEMSCNSTYQHPNILLVLFSYRDPACLYSAERYLSPLLMELDWRIAKGPISNAVINMPPWLI